MVKKCAWCNKADCKLEEFALTIKHRNVTSSYENQFAHPEHVKKEKSYYLGRVRQAKWFMFGIAIIVILGVAAEPMYTVGIRQSINEYLMLRLVCGPLFALAGLLLSTPMPPRGGNP